VHRTVALASVVLVLGCAPKVDFARIRPGVCAEEQVPCDDGHAWVEVTPEFEPRTLVYVIDTLSIPVADAEGRVPGFDLDGMDSGAGTDAPEASCEEVHADFVSSVEPSLSGVDNELQRLVPGVETLFDPADCPGGTTDGCLDASFQREIDEGRQLFLLEVSNVESFTIDDHVDVALYEAERPASDPPTVGPDGRLAPGQAFSGALVGRGSGTLLGGRLAFSTPRFPLVFVIPGGFDFYVPLREVQIRADFGEEELRRGALGGKHLPFPAADEPACAHFFTAPYIDTSLDDETCCGAPGPCCNAISAGLTFTATRAELRP
jgi:hypothetical protein